jgi:hypothetical protein
MADENRFHMAHASAPAALLYQRYQCLIDLIGGGDDLGVCLVSSLVDH